MATRNTEELNNVKPEKEKMVKVLVPYIEGEDPEVTLWVNDENLKFKKGYSVEIPERFAEVLENANQMAVVARENKKQFKNQRQDW